jgi:hypothetical protein
LHTRILQKQPFFAKECLFHPPLPWHGVCGSNLIPVQALQRKGDIMKTKMKYILPIAAMGLAMGLAPQALAGGPGSGLVMPPIVETQPVFNDDVVMAPSEYVYDGYENVGIVNNQYYYLGPGNVWIPMDGTRQNRFDDWQRSHANWQNYAIHNDRYQTVEYRGQLVNTQPTQPLENRQDQYRNSPINQTDQNGPPIRAEQDHNGPAE